MTVRANKPVFNVREKLKELTHSIGLKGRELMRAATLQEARDAISAGRKNLVINGDMRVSQRNGDGYSGNFGTAGGDYIVDRFSGYNTIVGTARGVQSQTAPPGFTYSCKYDITVADTPRTATSYSGLYYQVEGYDALPLKWQTPSQAKPCTVSFWVRASVAGTYSLSVRDAVFAQHYVAPYQINQVDTWEYKTITIPPPPSGTFGISNDLGFSLFWGIDIESTASGTTLNPNVWGSGNKYGVVGMAHLFSTVSNAFYITGVQCEVGKNATEFEYRSFAEELSLCQRYYYQLGSSVGGSAGSRVIGPAYTPSTNEIAMQVHHPTTMRVEPTCTIVNTNANNNLSALRFRYTGNNNFALAAAGTILNNYLTREGGSVWFQNLSHGVTSSGEIRTNESNGALEFTFLRFDAELS